MPENAAPRRFTWRRILVLVALLFAAFATYRLFFVYTIRLGTCQFPITPAEPVQTAAPRFPARQAEARQAGSVIVMSYNPQGHAALIRGDHLDQIAEVIRTNKPDVVGMQELHRKTWQSRFRDQVTEIARLTGMNVHFGPSFQIMGADYGNAVLTRGRIINAIVHPLPSLGEPRTLLEATIDLDGNRLNFYVTHLATWGKFNRAARLEQLQCIAEHVRRSRYPYVVVGDFNAVPDTPEIVWFQRSALVRMCGLPEEPTHRLTQQRLDYIFADPGWQPTLARVLAEGPSDHWPLIAELKWEE